MIKGNNIGLAGHYRLYTSAMSTINTTTTTIGDCRVVEISGNLTFDYEQMKQELAPRYESMFGDAAKVIKELGPKLTITDINELTVGGTTWNFYNSNNIWCYFCVRASEWEKSGKKIPGDYANYMFSPSDSENRDSGFARLRGGVLKFFLDGFDVYIVHHD